MGTAGKEALYSCEIQPADKRIVIFNGPEGSGKSVQAGGYSQDHNIPLIVVGDLVRNVLINDKTDFGNSCREQIAQNSVLNQQTLSSIMVPLLEQDDYKNGFVLDGALRTYEQVEHFEDMLKEAGREMPVTVVYLRIPGWKSFDRLIDGRKREDDTEERLFARLGRHYNNLGISMSLARKKWNFIQVDGGKSIEEVRSDIRQKEKTFKLL